MRFQYSEIRAKFPTVSNTDGTTFSSSLPGFQVSGLMRRQIDSRCNLHMQGINTLLATLDAMAGGPISQKHVGPESMIMGEPETTADETPPREAVSTSGFQSSQESCATTLAPIEDQDVQMYGYTPGSVKNAAVGVRHFVTYVFMCSPRASGRTQLTWFVCAAATTE